MNSKVSQDTVTISPYEYRLRFCLKKNLFINPRSYQNVLGNFLLSGIGLQKEESARFLQDRFMGILSVWSSINQFTHESQKADCIRDTVQAFAAAIDPKAGPQGAIQMSLLVELTTFHALDRAYMNRLEGSLHL